MLNSLRRFFAREDKPAPSPASRPAPPPDPDLEPADVVVPELPVEELRAAIEQQTGIVVLDVREPYEWSQVHLPVTAGWTVLHIPMNSLPARLDELPRDRRIAVLCAHGNRSYGVTHYLLTQGYQASNVTGGITRWAIAGGPVER